VGRAREDEEIVREAREEILKRIQQAAGRNPDERIADFARIRREYRQAETLNAGQRLALFMERLHDYNAATHLCTWECLPKTIADCLAARSARRILVATGLSEEWLPPDFEYVREDKSLSYRAIEEVNGAITACSMAIAMTGTIILQDPAPGQCCRALSLIPDYHLCIVDEDHLVETVPEAIRAIEKNCLLATTTISGPSATSDIEMTRIKGVHGPRTLEVIIVKRVQDNHTQ
jgi:L-lactate dehydrogenase complex protein LldG